MKRLLSFILIAGLFACGKEPEVIEPNPPLYQNLYVSPSGNVRITHTPRAEFEEHFIGKIWNLTGIYTVSDSGVVSRNNYINIYASSLKISNSFRTIWAEEGKGLIYFNYGRSYNHGFTWDYTIDSRLAIKYDPGFYWGDENPYSEVDYYLQVMDIDEESLTILVLKQGSANDGLAALLYRYEPRELGNLENSKPWLSGGDYINTWPILKDQMLVVDRIYKKTESGYEVFREQYNFVADWYNDVFKIAFYDNGETYYAEKETILREIDYSIWVRYDPKDYSFDEENGIIHLADKDGKTYQAKLLQDYNGHIVIEGNLGITSLLDYEPDATYIYIGEIDSAKARKKFDLLDPAWSCMLFEDSQKLVDNVKEIDDERFVQMLKKTYNRCAFGTACSWTRQINGEWVNDYGGPLRCSFWYLMTDDNTGHGLYSCCGAGEIMDAVGAGTPEGHENIDVTFEWRYEPDTNCLIFDIHLTTKEGRVVDKTVTAEVVWFDGVYCMLDGNFMNMYEDEEYGIPVCDETTVVTYDYQRLFWQMIHPAYLDGE